MKLYGIKTTIILERASGIYLIDDKIEEILKLNTGGKVYKFLEKNLYSFGLDDYDQMINTCKEISKKINKIRRSVKSSFKKKKVS